MVGRHTVAEHGKGPSPEDVDHAGDLSPYAVEERRALHVGGARLPRKAGAATGIERRPPRPTVVQRGVGGSELVAPEHLSHHLVDFGRAWPQVCEQHHLALWRDAQRLSGEVDVYGAGQGVGHDEGRRSEVVHAHLGVDATLEVAVP